MPNSKNDPNTDPNKGTRAEGKTATGHLDRRAAVKKDVVPRLRQRQAIYHGRIPTNPISIRVKAIRPPTLKPSSMGASTHSRTSSS